MHAEIRTPAVAPAAVSVPVADTMTAVVAARYGGPEVLSLAERPRPRPGAGEVVVRVGASSINFGDAAMMTARPRAIRLATGLWRPRQPVPGLDVAGTVVEVGAGVSQLQVGDRVFGVARGAWAELATARADKLARLPAGVSFEQAAALPVSGITALQGLRDVADVQPGQRVLVIGAAGSVGSFAVQIGRALGAEVTGVCSGRNAAFVRALGATDVIDYAREDYTRTEARYDAILDLVGSASIGACLRLLTPRGVYVASAGQRLRRVMWAAMRALVPGSRVRMLVSRERTPALEALVELVASGQITSAIEQRVPLTDVRAAMRDQLTGHSRGKTVLVVR